MSLIDRPEEASEDELLDMIEKLRTHQSSLMSALIRRRVETPGDVWIHTNGVLVRLKFKKFNAHNSLYVSSDGCHVRYVRASEAERMTKLAAAQGLLKQAQDAIDSATESKAMALAAMAELEEAQP